MCLAENCTLVWVIYFIQSHNVICTYPTALCIYICIWVRMHVPMTWFVVFKMYSMVYEAWYLSQHMGTMNSWQSTYIYSHQAFCGLKVVFMYSISHALCVYKIIRILPSSPGDSYYIKILWCIFWKLVFFYI